MKRRYASYAKWGLLVFLARPFDGHVVQAQVQDGIHHAGHGSTSAGTNGNQQGVLCVAELLAGDLLGLGQSVIDLLLDLIVDLLAIGRSNGCRLRW